MKKVICIPGTENNPLPTFECPFCGHKEELDEYDLDKDGMWVCPKCRETSIFEF